METKVLYRPIGEKELVLIAESNFSRFPPRLSWQPIFYPVLNQDYAEEIASKWNINDEAGNYLGFVTKFSVNKEEFEKYEVKCVGGCAHEELWVPAENLEAFNEAVNGQIEIVNVFKGEQFISTEHKVVRELLEKFFKK